jgi:broad specificity phosphatase PhoE
MRPRGHIGIAYFITHPDVTIDPSVPIPDWSLSSEGVRRMVRLLDRAWVGNVRAVFTSAERKAVEAAKILADHLSLEPIVIADLGENDRSATGYLPKAEFERVADEFFGHPDESIRGWERAVDAQRRIIRAVDCTIAMAPPDGDIAIISHGAVGALLRCHLKGVPISRTEDQPAGRGGNLYSFDIEPRRLLSLWHRIDE